MAWMVLVPPPVKVNPPPELVTFKPVAVSILPVACNPLTRFSDPWKELEAVVTF